MILGHQKILQQFQKLLSKGKMHHAFLFKGPKGVGKFKTALDVAKLCLNEDIPTSFIEKGLHPSVRILKNMEKSNISVAEVREALSFLSYKTDKGGWKVLIIDAITDLNIQGQNALLKDLEEPPKNTLFLMIEHDGYKTLKTIESRALTYYFQKLSKHDMKHFANNLNVSEQVLTLAMGSPGQLEELMKIDSVALYQKIITSRIKNQPLAFLKDLKSDLPLKLLELSNLRAFSLLEEPIEIYEGEFNDLKTLIHAMDFDTLEMFKTYRRQQALNLDPSSIAV